jgi:hypothetical protein
MELEITKTEKETVKINLPFYCTDGIAHAYKVFSEEHCISALYPTSDEDTHIGISVNHARLAFNSKNDEAWKEITEVEFNQLFVATILALKKLNNK